MSTYSAKKYWTIAAGALAVMAMGIAVILWLARNHTDPASIGLFRVLLSAVVIGLALWARGYRDEVQRQMGQKRWFRGSMIGIAAMLPVVVFLQTHRPWLDAAVQMLFRHPPMPALYFSLGIMIPIVFQAASTLILQLLDKLSSGSQS